MGLDMYLKGEKFIHGVSNPQKTHPFEDGFPLEARVLRLGQWRKHRPLHDYICKHFAGVEDTCEEIPLTAKCLRKITAKVKEGFDDYHDPAYAAVARELQPATVKTLKSAVDWAVTRDKAHSRSVVYQADW